MKEVLMKLELDLEAATTHKELYLAAAGLLFPNSDRQMVLSLEKEVKDRLLNLYRSRKSEILDAKEKAEYRLVIDGITKLKLWSKEAPSQEEAKAVLNAAFQTYKETGKKVLSYQEYLNLKEIAAGKGPAA